MFAIAGVRTSSVRRRNVRSPRFVPECRVRFDAFFSSVQTAERYRAGVSAGSTGLPPAFPRGRRIRFARLSRRAVWRWAGRQAQERGGGARGEHADERPLPALVALLALLLLTALVWWRVLHRGGASSGAAPAPPTTPSATLPAPAGITLTVFNATNPTRARNRGARPHHPGRRRLQRRPARRQRQPQAKVPGVAEIRYGPTSEGCGAPGALLLPRRPAGAPTRARPGQWWSRSGPKYRSVATPTAVRGRVAPVPRSRVDAPPSGPEPGC